MVNETNNINNINDHCLLSWYAWLPTVLCAWSTHSGDLGGTKTIGSPDLARAWSPDHENRSNDALTGQSSRSKGMASTG